MIKLSFPLWIQVCLLAGVMSLCACGQREIVLPQDSTNVAANRQDISAQSATSSSTPSTNAMRLTGKPERNHNGGGGPIIVIEDTHFKSTGSK